MPHATECSANLHNNNASVLSSSPIPIPGSANGYGRNSSSSSHNVSAMVTRSTTINDYNCDPISLQDADNMNIGFDQSYSAVSPSDETTYASTITPDPMTRNLQPYLRDYNCCGVDHQNLVELLQHVDNFHPGLIFDTVNGVIIPFEASTVYSQDRWGSIPTPVSSVSTPLMTNSSMHEQKNNTFNTFTSASLYTVNTPSFINHKQKVNINGLGQYNQSGIGQINGFDQISGIEQINGTMASQNQDLSCEQWMLAACQLSLLCNSSDPNLSSTLNIGDQTPSSISTSLDDDNSFLDVPSKSLQMNQDPLLVSPLLSISSTPIDYLQSSVSSPISSDDNSVIVSPISNDQAATISKLANINLQDNASQRRSSSTLSLQNTSYGSISNTSRQGSSDNDSNGVNSQQRRSSSSSINVSMTSNQQHSYRSISNSRQKPISPISNSHIARPSFDNIKVEQGPINADTNKFPIVPRRFLQTTSNVDGNSTIQPRRSSTTIIPSQSVTTAPQNEQYGSIISNLGQSSRPVVQLRRSSTSNVSSARSIATTTSPAYNISIDKSKFATYMPSVTAAQYVNAVDGYHSLVGHVSSRETGSGAVAPFAAKYHPIQPKAGVAMSDVYTDPALDVSGMKSSKKRTVSTSSIDAKSTKRRVTKPSDESVAEAPVAVLPADLSEIENKGEADIYPYKCVVPGCPKVYKNANGLKYHNEHGHASQSGNGAREKPWACHVPGCLKTYGSKGGLIYHVKHCHPNDLWALP